MPQKQFVLSDWIGKLSGCLQELVSYEQRLESDLLFLRQRGEMALGIPGNTHHQSRDNVRERISLYSLLAPRERYTHSEYRQNISQELSRLLKVLLEHPTFKGAVYDSDDGPVLGLDLGISRVRAHQMVFVLQGLVDYALEHSPEATANALVEMICRGENHDLNSYSIMLFRGLHVERRHDFRGGLSIISFEEARQYMSDSIVHSLLGEGTDAGRGPIGAVVSEVKWGPAIVPASHDMEADWPEESETFREDALLLVDLLAVTHGLPVVTTRWRTSGVERRVEHLVGRVPSFPRTTREMSGAYSLNRVPPTTPAVSGDRLSEVSQLLADMPKDDDMLRPALSRLALSLSRSGPRAVSDGIVDVAIALETMYRPGSELRYRLGTWTSYFLEESAQDRLATYEKLVALYKARSDIVHGRRADGRADDEDIYKGGFHVARRTLSKLVLEGGPSNTTEWDELVIAGESE